MSSESKNPGDLDPVELAAIAAVEGLSSLTDEEAAVVDPEEVARFEAAAGAVFVALSAGPSKGRPCAAPSDAISRLEASAGAFFAARFEREAAIAERDLGVSDAQRILGDGVPQAPLRPLPKSSPVPDAPAATGTVSGPRSNTYLALAGWAAAAALLFGFLQARGRISDLTSDQAPLTAEANASTDWNQLAALDPDAKDLPWAPLGGEELAGGVLWSDERNEGFMKLSGLPVNDPEVSQYQLWIFRGTDPGSEPHPVDGGVFDVRVPGEVVIPIDAAIRVGSAGTFAVTVEAPGGVVVSDREQIVALAQIPQ